MQLHVIVEFDVTLGVNCPEPTGAEVLEMLRKRLDDGTEPHADDFALQPWRVKASPTKGYIS